MYSYGTENAYLNYNKIIKLFYTKLSQKILNYDVNKIEYSEHI